MFTLKTLQKNKKAERGFTILETLVAISILVIAITGPLAIISQSLRASFFARDQITAFYLAQEAIEYIRNQRDTNTLQSADWLETIRGDCQVNNFGSEVSKCHMVMDVSSYEIRSCSIGTCPRLKYSDPDSSIGADNVYYGLDNQSLPDSKYTREIILQSSGEIYDLAVIVRVKWQTPSGENKVELRSMIYDWQSEPDVTPAP
jgi:prepilin-type N-terminal cleavage/methylation domain-containing protein